MAGERILIVDDEMELAEIVRDYLRADGYTIRIAQDGEEALSIFKEFKPQLVVLDVMLPKIDGMEVCRRMRSESSVPILMLSAKSGDVDKILSLGLGADDYITKPFSPGELVARVRAQLRRYLELSAAIKKDSPNTIKFGDVIVEVKSHSVFKGEKPVTLTAKEFEVLYYMACHPQQVFTREQLFDQIWGYDEYGDINTVTVHIRKIREKIENLPSEPEFIKTVWGVGYKFDGGKNEAIN